MNVGVVPVSVAFVANVTSPVNDCVPVAATPAPRLVVPLTETSVTPVISPPTTAFPLIASARPPPASVDDVVIVVPARVVFAASETASP